ELQGGWIVVCELRADLFPIGRGFGIGVPGGKSFPDRASRAVEESWADPAILDRRVDIGRVGSRAANARETKRAVVRHFDRAGFLTEFQDSSVAKGEPRPIEGVEILEDQQRHRLSEIERRLANRAEEIAGIELGNADAGSREVGCSHSPRSLRRSAQARKVEALVHLRRIRCSKEHGMRCFRGPTGEIDGTKIRCVELGSRNLGHAVNPTGSGGGGIPALPSRQRLAGSKVRFLGNCQRRDAERNPARRGRFDEVTSRNSHCAAPLLAEFILYVSRRDLMATVQWPLLAIYS